jgi:hypothetical protein
MLNFLVALATDGVVIDPTILPSAASYPYNLGRTAHEVGHWMNLRHIWEMLLVEVI